MGLKHGVYTTAAWRNLAALEHFRDQPDAMTNVQHAITATPGDAAGWVLKARIGLDTDDQTALMDALDDAKHADRTAGGARPEAKRILALAMLRLGEFDRAIAAAEDAIKLGDMHCPNKLIQAAALAAKGDGEAASVSLTDAIRQWPHTLMSDTDWYASADAGELWFESAAELLALRRETEARLKSDPASQP